MKSTGIVRKLDKLGRIVIPIELRRVLDIYEKAPIEIFVEGDMIILKNYKPLCYICGDSEKLKDYKNVRICSHCIEFAKNIKI